MFSFARVATKNLLPMTFTNVLETYSYNHVVYCLLVHLTGDQGKLGAHIYALAVSLH